MKSKLTVSFIGVLIAILTVAFLVNATSIPVVVTPDNLVLRDQYGNIVATSLTVALINNTNGYVQLARALTESGTTFPTVPAVGYLYYRTDMQSLFIWTGLQWVTAMSATLPPGTISYNDLSNKPDLTVYLLENGANSLTGDWNVGSHGIYGLTYLTTTLLTTSLLNVTSNFYGYGSFWWNNQNRTDVIANPTAPYSYIIDISGGKYRVKNGATGNIDYQSTNVATVSQTALTALTATGGTIMFKTGEYHFLNTVTIPAGINGLSICGEGATTVFIMTPDDGATDNDTLFEVGQDVTNLMFSDFKVYMTDSERFLNSTAGLGRCWFKNLVIDNEATDYIGIPIYIKYITGFSTYELHFDGCTISGGTEVLHIESVVEVWISNCKFGGSNYTLAKSRLELAGVVYPRVSDCGFERCRLEGYNIRYFSINNNWWSAYTPDRAMYIYASHDGVISNNQIWNVTQEDLGLATVGIWLDGLASNPTQRIQIIGNVLTFTSVTNATTFGILNGVNATCVNSNIIMGNDVSNCSVFKRIFNPDVNTTVRYNLGRLTELAGNSTGTGAEQTFVTYLDAAIQEVVVIPTETGVNVTNLWHAGANFFVTVTAGKTYDWFIQGNGVDLP